ncbi:MAG: DUF2520 domain-containing protein [Clostridiales Family XIII bacterium]|jgi:predicted short-subunit dehydrogenase-like oxidoreductase (DUF2520 family)|nr:DUF2520 domain-containing protein [Clostridiales Family XIII bacterium]
MDRGSRQSGNPEQLPTRAATESLRVGFIGAGKAGTSFGKYIAVRAAEQNRAEVSLSGYFSLNRDSATSAAALTGSAAFTSGVHLAEASDIIFFSVPDGKIEPAFHALIREGRDARVDLSGKTFAHLSGSLSSEIFDGPDLPARSAFSLHPVCALPDRGESWGLLREACFVFEGADEARERITPLLGVLGNPVGTITPDRKTLYHAACVFLSNFSVGLAAQGTGLLALCGLEPEISSKFLQTLFLGNAENVARLGPAEALTGPAERGDADTIREHMDALSGLGDESLTDVYRGLTKVLLRIAGERHPGRDYSDAHAAIGSDSGSA